MITRIPKKALYSSKLILLLLLLLQITLGTAQDLRVVTGTVRSEQDNQPMPGVSVTVLSTNKGTTTDGEGHFKIQANPNDSLIFHFVGYQSRHIIADHSPLDILLQNGSNLLGDVVVVGYGTEKKEVVTGAIGTVKSKDFVKGAVKDAAQLITGKVAGLSVSSSTGDPTAGTEIMLRGISTLMSSTAPLILIDGIPGDLKTVAPEDIASVDVLKDGSAAAIYGTRATNGVILITTKKYNANQSKLQYDGYLSVQTIAKRPEFLDAADYRRLIKDGVAYTDYGTSTDWFAAISRTPVSHTHNFLLQGGNAQTNYTANINYSNWQGLLKRSDNTNLRANFDINHSMFNDKVKIHLNAIMSKRKYWAGGDGYSFNTYIYRQALIRNPTDSIRHADGSFVTRDGYFYDNPVALLEGVDGENTEKEIRLNGSIIYQPIKSLIFKLLASDNSWMQTRGYATNSAYPSNAANGWGNAYASRGQSNTEDHLLEFTTNYDKAFGAHHVNILGGYSYQDAMADGFWENNWYFPTDVYGYNNMGAGDALSEGSAGMGSGKSENKLIGFFGRINYNYAEKYLFMASVRREGSSKFGKNYRWGMFPAVSAGWRISQEDFLKNSKVISDLKLRAGFGITGTAPSDDYDALTTLNYGDRFLYNGNWVQGLSPTRNPNPNLRWEQKQEYNLGIDFALFNHFVSGSIDVYQRDTKDMLYDYPVPVPPYLYSTILANVGKMRNKGLEILLNFNPVTTKDFSWNSGVTFSTNKNTLVSINNDQFNLTQDWFTAGYTGEPIQTYTHRVEVGQPIGNFYGWKSVDIDEDGVWQVLNKDGEVISIKDATEEDKRVLGNGLPKYYLSWNNSFRYKQFDLSMNMHGAFGYQVLDFLRLFYENPRNAQYNMLKSAFDKVYNKAELDYDLSYVSHYIENGDYWKIDNVTLGYTIPLKTKKTFSSARVYASGLNLITITGYKGIDPEVNRSGLAPGNDDRDKYPTTRTFTLGVNLTF
jgi:TonB-linked SusC/RagA family outer membrane protein